MKKLHIQILTDKNSWTVYYADNLGKLLKRKNHQAKLIYSESKVENGDILIIFGWYKIIPKNILNRNKYNLVVHPSALPKGKGCSPLTWQILEDKNKIPITLFEAVEQVDAGDIYFKDIMYFQGHELLDELKKQQGKKSIEIIYKFIQHYPNIKGVKQKGKSNYYSRRTQKDSEIDINKSIKEQFNLLRIVDNKNYPAFFWHKGHKYILNIIKEDNK